jgi:hypothetical protein
MVKREAAKVARQAAAEAAQAKSDGKMMAQLEALATAEEEAAEKAFNRMSAKQASAKQAAAAKQAMAAKQAVAKQSAAAAKQTAAAKQAAAAKRTAATKQAAAKLAMELDAQQKLTKMKAAQELAMTKKNKTVAAAKAATAAAAAKRIPTNKLAEDKAGRSKSAGGMPSRNTFVTKAQVHAADASSSSGVDMVGASTAAEEDGSQTAEEIVAGADQQLLRTIRSVCTTDMQRGIRTFNAVQIMRDSVKLMLSHLITSVESLDDRFVQQQVLLVEAVTGSVDLRELPFKTDYALNEFFYRDPEKFLQKQRAIRSMMLSDLGACDEGKFCAPNKCNITFSKEPLALALAPEAPSFQSSL